MYSMWHRLQDGDSAFAERVASFASPRCHSLDPCGGKGLPLPSPRPDWEPLIEGYNQRFPWYIESEPIDVLYRVDKLRS